MERIITWLYGIPIDAVLIGTSVCTTWLIVDLGACVVRPANRPRLILGGAHEQDSSILLRARSLSDLFPYLPLRHRLCHRLGCAEGDRRRAGHAGRRGSHRQSAAAVAVRCAAQRDGKKAVQAMVDALRPAGA